MSEPCRASGGISWKPSLPGPRNHHEGNLLVVDFLTVMMFSGLFFWVSFVILVWLGASGGRKNNSRGRIVEQPRVALLISSLRAFHRAGNRETFWNINGTRWGKLSRNIWVDT